MVDVRSKTFVNSGSMMLDRWSFLLSVGSKIADRSKSLIGDRWLVIDFAEVILVQFVTPLVQMCQKSFWLNEIPIISILLNKFSLWYKWFWVSEPFENPMSGNMPVLCIQLILLVVIAYYKVAARSVLFRDIGFSKGSDTQNHLYYNENLFRSIDMRWVLFDENYFWDV